MLLAGVFLCKKAICWGNLTVSVPNLPEVNEEYYKSNSSKRIFKRRANKKNDKEIAQKKTFY